MKTKPSECRKQARAENEANIHKASFTERRLFYLNRLHVIARRTHLPWYGLSRTVPGRAPRSVIILLLMVFLAVLLPLPVRAQTPVTPPEVTAILNSMTPEERVGQLFLVTFTGTDTSSTSQIYNLMTQYHVGGVVLLAQNDNFAAAPDTVAQAHSLINNIQQLEWDTSENPVINPATGKAFDSAYVPLFVGIAQEGNGYPTDQILSGLTPLPSEMAIGATWDTKLATRVGEVHGRELAALGFNLYLGPSLDVLEAPSVSGGDLGTRVFGGDPYWVGEM